MRVRIPFCVVGNSQPRAAGLAAELREAYPEAEILTVPSSGGVFDVTADDTLIFSKRAARRHAAPGEVLALMREKGF